MAKMNRNQPPPTPRCQSSPPGRRRKAQWVIVRGGFFVALRPVPPDSHTLRTHSHAAVVAGDRADRAPGLSLILPGGAREVDGKDDGSEADGVVQHGKPEDLAEKREKPPTKNKNKEKKTPGR